MQKIQIILGCAVGFLFPSLAYSQDAPTNWEYGLGAVLDRDTYLKVPKAPPLARGDYDLPSRVSLKNYTPPVGNQGRAGSCVGWASAYAARTLAEVRRQDISQPRNSFHDAFSPAYVYNQVRVNKSNCKEGSNINDALWLLEFQGVLPVDEFSYSDKTCSRMPTSGEKHRARNFRIKDYRRLTSWKSRNPHVPIRKALASGHPVIIGMMVGTTFMKHKKAKPVRFTEREREQMRNSNFKGFGGHAMTIIGYDDDQDGGSFEIMNSWGTGWGNNGFFWITYKDFALFNRSSYEIIPLDPIKPPKKPDFGGSLKFVHMNGKEMSFATTLKPLSSKLSSSYPSGTRFRVELKSMASTFAYVFGGDDSGKRFVKLFPRNETLSPVLGKGDTLLLPGPTEEYFSRMNEREGFDYYVVLLSKKELDIDLVLRKFNTSCCKSSVQEHIQNFLGDRVALAKDVKRDGPSSFKVVSNDNTILAHVVEIEHRGKAEEQQDVEPPLLIVSDPPLEKESWVEGDKDIRVVSTDLVVINGKAQDMGKIQNVESDDAYEVKFSTRGSFRLKVDLTGKAMPFPVKVVAVDANGNKSEKTIYLQKYDGS